MRHLLRLSLARLAAALAVAALPMLAAAQEASQIEGTGATFASPLADATWMKRYALLDEDTLGQQRCRAPGFAVVTSASQQLAGSGSVTLWDEIAPPAPIPMPVPVDAQRAMQGNNASYTRK